LINNVNKLKRGRYLKNTWHSRGIAKVSSIIWMAPYLNSSIFEWPFLRLRAALVDPYDVHQWKLPFPDRCCQSWTSHRSRRNGWPRCECRGKTCLSFSIWKTKILLPPSRKKADWLWLIFTVVNFINILRINFSYKWRFSSFFYVHVTRKKLPKLGSYKKLARKMLMKLTPEKQLNIMDNYKSFFIENCRFSYSNCYLLHFS